MMKYVMFADDKFVILPEFVGHNEIRINCIVVSAGFCMFNPSKDGTTKVSVWGESSSLGIKSREDDARIIQRQINSHLD